MRLQIEQPNTNRRDFLVMSTAVAGSALLTGGMTPCATAEPKRKFDSPLHVPFDKMKLSLAGYSLRSYMQQNWPSPRKRSTPATMTIDDFVDYCGSLKLDGCEPTSYYFPRPVTTKYLESLRERVKRNKLQISATAIGNDFCLPEGEARQRQLKLCKLWIDYAAIMKAPSIRIFAGRVPRGGSEKEAIRQCQKGINECLDYAREKGVGLALENHGGITATPKQMMRIIDGIKPSPWFGVNFDGGNFRTDDPYRDLAKIAPLAINAQLKMSIVRKGKREAADLKKTLQILKDAGYRGWVALEYEEREDPKKEIPKIIDKLRGLMSDL